MPFYFRGNSCVIDWWTGLLLWDALADYLLLGGFVCGNKRTKPKSGSIGVERTMEGKCLTAVCYQSQELVCDAMVQPTKIVGTVFLLFIYLFAVVLCFVCDIVYETIQVRSTVV